MKNRSFFYFLLLIPWIAIFLIFWFYPLVYSFILSLSSYKTLSGEITFVFLDNYAKIFNDPDFWNALKNTFIFTFGTVPITVFLSLILAVMIDNTNGRFKEFLRGSYFLPSVTSLVVISLIFTNLYLKDGYLNTLSNFLGLPFPDKGMLLEPSSALLSIMGMEIWISVGYYMLLFLAALQTIPKDLYDSADLFGASSRSKFINITVPLVKPTLLFVFIINTIKSFQVFVEIYVMTKGGPLKSTTTLVFEVFDKGFNQINRIGEASAIAYILFLILIVLSLIQFKLLKTK